MAKTLTKKRLTWAIALLVALFASAVATVWMLNVRGEAPVTRVAPMTVPASPAQIERGKYLAQAGNCISCHTVRGGPAYAGGRGIDTPFGAVYAPNLTPHAETGMGTWSPDHFWRAMHHGRSKDGRLLYPAFPYTEYTHVTREDSDAIFAYLHSLPPVAQPNRDHTLRFPYNSQWALAVWRALFFTPGANTQNPHQSADWNRGAYLVQGLGHCVACHSPRNALGASSLSRSLQGGIIPLQNWYAPGLTSSAQAGVADWPLEDVVALLKTGIAPHGSAMGPMAEVVFNSTQHLSDADAHAMAVYLRALPQEPAPVAHQRSVVPAPDAMRLGAQVYDQQCAQCHGASGEGQPGAFPALAGNRAVTMASPINVVQAVLHGGYLPATAGNPRPFGMPPFTHVLNDAEVAAVLSFVRASWGNQAAPVTAIEVYRQRESR
mgnify:FL=1